MFTMKFSVTDQPKLADLISQAGERTLDAAGAVILDNIRKRFRAETDPDGSRWIESENAKARRAKGINNGTLYDTGKLFSSIQLVNRGKGLREIFTDVKYAAQHNFGYFPYPRRTFIGASTEDVSIAVQILKRNLGSIPGVTGGS